MFLFRKQNQYGQGFGAIIRKYGRYMGTTRTFTIHTVKILLLVALCIPPLSLLSLIALSAMAIAFSWRVFKVPDWRILLIVPVNIIQWAVFFFSSLVGFVTGRQAVYYK